jgi:hypothetical protein
METENNYWSTERIDDLLRRVDEEGLDFKSVDNPFHDNNPDLKRSNVLWNFTEDEILEIQKCAKDATYFSKYCKVVTDSGLAYIELRDYQSSVIREYQSNRFNVFLAPRQVGKSIMSAIFLVWYLLFNHDKNAMILANVGDTAEELMDKIKAIIKGLPFFLKPGMLVNNVMSMRFDNGCRVIAKTTTKTTGIGFTIHFLYMDEFAHINPNFIESFFRSTYPTVSSSKVSRIIITSTPNGMNKFHDIYQGALTKDNSFNPIRVDWWQVPGRDQEWKMREIGNLGSEELFNQEYGNQFLSSSSLLLGSNELKNIKHNEMEYCWREIDFLHDEECSYENLIWHPLFNFDGIANKVNKFVLSVDLAAGGGGDFSVINIFKVVPLPEKKIEAMRDFVDESDFFGLLQVGVYRDNEAKLEDVNKILELLVIKMFGVDSTKIALEMNFKGELLLDKMLNNEDLYEEIFLYTKHSESAKNMKAGIKYNAKNKLKYCETIRSLIRKNVIMPNEKNWTIPELFSFGLNNRGTYSSQSGNDDVVMTIVNLAGFFEYGDFYDLIGEIYDSLDNKYRLIMDRKLSSINQVNPSSYSPYDKFVPQTKDGSTFKFFNDLI